MHRAGGKLPQEVGEHGATSGRILKHPPVPQAFQASVPGARAFPGANTPITAADVDVLRGDDVEAGAGGGFLYSPLGSQ